MLEATELVKVLWKERKQKEVSLTLSYKGFENRKNWTGYIVQKLHWVS